jgi:hypothetical protein
MWKPDLVWWELVVRAVVVYAFLLVLLRLSGKRQVGQLAPFDLVLLLVLSNAVQNSMNGGDNSITGGLILAAVTGTLGLTSARHIGVFFVPLPFAVAAARDPRRRSASRSALSISLPARAARSNGRCRQRRWERSRSAARPPASVET